MRSTTIALLAACCTVAAIAGPGASPASAAVLACDSTAAGVCLFPWPSDRYTRRDKSTPTGRRLALPRESMPVNKDGRPIDPTDFNRADGFSPGQAIVTSVPGLDNPKALRRTGAAGVTDIGRSRGRRQPIVVINARTGKRHLIWSEIDANAYQRRDVALIVHPAVNFEEGERYIVALRRLRGSKGGRLGARQEFRVFRDRLKITRPDLRGRRRHMESIFRSLRRAGIRRRSLYLAWDFTVASRRSLTGRLVSMRDRAFAQLGDRNLSDLRPQGRAPSFSVDTVTPLAPCGSNGCGPGESDEIARRVEGSFRVPCFLNRPGCPVGSRFRLGRRGLPVQNKTAHTARFLCLIPRSASAAAPARLLMYGHGLFGGRAEISRLSSLANGGRIVICATDWIGMATEDIPNVVDLSGDLSKFPTLVDRVQQGMLNFLFLGRLMIHGQGFASHPAFQEGDRPVLDTRRLFFAGGSQGGILGGALTAVAPDFERAALIVPGMNFSVLLPRSTQFDAFARVLYPAYPEQLTRPLVLSMIQVLWDRGEANGYAHHITRDPLPDTPRHEVVLHMAFGDHQVANVATETEARTIGARLRTPALDRGRSTDRRPFFGIRRIGRYPFRGNALVTYDIGPLRAGGMGTPAPPITNTAPRAGIDPHGVTAFAPAAADQFSRFLSIGGAFENTCGPEPCYAAGYTGAP